MRIKIKKLQKEAVIPAYANPTDAGMDLTATSVVWGEDYIQYGTGLAVEIPEGYVGLLFPRSSISKLDLTLANSVGVIDSGYRGEIQLRFKTHNTDFFSSKKRTKRYAVGDRVGQLIVIPHPKIVWEVEDELAESERGTGGFGSTGS